MKRCQCRTCQLLAVQKTSCGVCSSRPARKFLLPFICFDCQAHCSISTCTIVAHGCQDDKIRKALCRIDRKLEEPAPERAMKALRASEDITTVQTNKMVLACETTKYDVWKYEPGSFLKLGVCQTANFIEMLTLWAVISARCCFNTHFDPSQGEVH